MWSVKLGFAPFLCIVFVLLKLFGAINWSWIMVLSPLWIGYGLIIVLLMTISLLNSLSRRNFNKYKSENKGQVFPKSLLRKFRGK
jgi:membrane protein YdbS with pleckstrin-like domain